jgi:hypothetical protein
VVQQTWPTLGAAPVTAPTPMQPTTTAQHPAILSSREPFRITPLLVVATLAAIVGIAAAVLDFVSFQVTGDVVTSQTLKMNDMSSNFLVAAIIGAVLLVAGAVAGATGRRLGAGLAGGAGLALAGLLAHAVGQATHLLDALQVQYLNQGGNFVLTTTQEIGFILAIVAAALGAITFMVSLRDARADGRAPIPVAIGFLGALGGAAVAFGSLIPTHGAKFGDNFAVDSIPPATLYLRLACLALIVVACAVGFLTNRRWGVGVALGGISIAVWQWVTSQSKTGDLPFGIARGNPPLDDGLLKPHVVTTIGVVVVLVAVIASLVTMAQRQTT